MLQVNQIKMIQDQKAADFFYIQPYDISEDEENI